MGKTSISAVVLTTCAAQVAGCSYVNKLVFANWCGKDIHLDGWNQQIAAGQTLDITWSRPSSNRIQWKYTDGVDYDFIELNRDWSGPGSPLCGHPSYSNYNGFSMASKYEALNPDTGAKACRDLAPQYLATPGKARAVQEATCATEVATARVRTAIG